jgi:hypothetical protein
MLKTFKGCAGRFSVMSGAAFELTVNEASVDEA